MRDAVLSWYAFLGALNTAVAVPLRDLGDAINVPAVSALLLGLIGATAPCQLTTNAGALAFLMGRSGGRAGAGTGGAVTASAAAFVLGKVLTYTVIGAVVIALGRGVMPLAGIVLVRRMLGPLMVVLGLFLMGALPLSFTVGGPLADWLERRGGAGVGGAFVLGTAFSLAFCPTLFLLFFALTIPLALTSPVGVVIPGLFAVGTSLPLVATVGALATGIGTARQVATRARSVDRWLRPAAGAVMLLAGLNDTVTYWLL